MLSLLLLLLLDSRNILRISLTCWHRFLFLRDGRLICFLSRFLFNLFWLFSKIKQNILIEDSYFFLFLRRFRTSLQHYRNIILLLLLLHLIIFFFFFSLLFMNHRMLLIIIIELIKVSLLFFFNHLINWAFIIIIAFIIFVLLRWWSNLRNTTTEKALFLIYTNINWLSLVLLNNSWVLLNCLSL
jgi:hypothetical protein